MLKLRSGLFALVIAAVGGLLAVAPAAQALTVAPMCNGQVATFYPGAPGANDTSSGVVVGTFGDDVIVGTDGDDTIDARGGNDSICARGGNDSIRADSGADFIFAGSGDDVAGGGAGIDQVSGGPGNDTVRGGSENDHVSGGKGTDVVQGGFGDDKINGGEGDDFLIGGTGTDRCDGANGADRSVGCENDVNVETPSAPVSSLMSAEAAPSWSDGDTNNPKIESEPSDLLNGDAGDTTGLTHEELVEQGDATPGYTTPE